MTFGDRGPLGSPRLCPRALQGEGSRPVGRRGASTRCRGVSHREPAPSSTGRGTRSPLCWAVLRSPEDQPDGRCLTTRQQVRGHSDGCTLLDIEGWEKPTVRGQLSVQERGPQWLLSPGTWAVYRSTWQRERSGLALRWTWAPILAPKNTHTSFPSRRPCFSVSKG